MQRDEEAREAGFADARGFDAANLGVAIIGVAVFAGLALGILYAIFN